MRRRLVRSRRRLPLVLVAGIVSAALLVAVGSAASAAASGGPIVVKLETDAADGYLADGECSTVPPTPQNPIPPVNLATCTLRAAIQNANKDEDKSVVKF